MHPPCRRRPPKRRPAVPPLIYVRGGGGGEAASIAGRWVGVNPQFVMGPRGPPMSPHGVPYQTHRDAHGFFIRGRGLHSLVDLFTHAAPGVMRIMVGSAIPAPAPSVVNVPSARSTPSPLPSFTPESRPRRRPAASEDRDSTACQSRSDGRPSVAGAPTSAKIGWSCYLRVRRRAAGRPALVSAPRFQAPLPSRAQPRAARSPPRRVPWCGAQWSSPVVPVGGSWDAVPGRL